MDHDTAREINGLKSELSGLKTELAGVMTRMDSMERIIRNIAAATSRIISELPEKVTKQNIVNLRSEINARHDGFIKLQDEMRFRWAVHADTLKKHDTRLSTLEARQT